MNFKDMRQLVKSYIQSFPGQTAKEYQRLMQEDGYKIEDSSVGGRISELKNDGEIVQAGRKECSRTKNMAYFYEITTQFNSHLINVKRNSKSKDIGTLLMEYLNNKSIPRIDKAKLLEDMKIKILLNNQVNLTENPFKKQGGK